MPIPPSFAPIAASLRDEVIEHYERLGARLDTDSGQRTLDTNSTLAADRARLLLRVLANAGGGPIAGRRVLDLGAGFGALAVYFAHLGAEVLALDPHEERLEVALAVARRFGLPMNTITGSAEALPLQDASFDIVVANNSLCYIVDRGLRRAALSEIQRVLYPGGWLLVRDPNRITPLDPFTGLPGLALLPPMLSDTVTKVVGRHRSRVRLNSPGSAVYELVKAGYTDVRWSRTSRRPWGRFMPYLHVAARRPE